MEEKFDGVKVEGGFIEELEFLCFLSDNLIIFFFMLFLKLNNLKKEFLVIVCECVLLFIKKLDVCDLFKILKKVKKVILYEKVVLYVNREE